MRETAVNVGVALQDAMRAIEQANPDTLSGIFGDAGWTNKDRLSDEILTNLIEHYSRHSLNLSTVPDDQLGNAYEYLIKEFADDSGHTAAEFYTNRTVVKLMTMIMDPQPGETVYDPTCGSGGLLLNCALHLRDEGKEYRTLKLYGQEINLITSAIARMNMFMHGIEEFSIVRGNTLENPAFLEQDALKKFDVILLIRRIPSGPGIRRGLPLIPGGEISGGFRRRAALIMPFSSISIQVWMQSMAALSPSGRTGFCFEMLRLPCAVKWWRRIWWNA
ncbi:N-6 DNA Methylase [Candidatus Electrothrix aarhusensis]|uniref:site-specific DNA-methyltransferase (adenine-specific) n=1 Tax=Candidatus Electrothrix aarhusensis TaxID=1859131 RepID=A0A3S3U7L8_9BACT|nr:N-6 DNA Methylase [Candidatus Electrothrix aarhusensis]